MKAVILCMSLLVLTVASPARAEELTAEKKKLIDEFLHLTSGDRMGELFASYYIQEIRDDVMEKHPDIDKRAFVIIEEEVNSVVGGAVKDDNAINELSYPIYHKYLTSEEITQLIQFYQSPIGQKTMAILPVISTEAMQAGEEWGRSLGPEILKRVQFRFDQESILKAQ